MNFIDSILDYCNNILEHLQMEYPREFDGLMIGTLFFSNH
jgi:hypothetical protein